MHRLLFLLSLFTLHLSLFGAPAPQLLRATLVGDNQLAPGATLTVQSGSTLTLASGSTLTAPANLLAWSAVDKTGSSLADLATRPWSALTGTPTTLAGYGITDAYASPLTTAGDLLYGGTAGAPTRLGIGTEGQVLSVDSGGLPSWSTLSGTGTVTSITAGTGLTGGTITSTGTIGLDTSGVTAGSYGSASAVPVLTVDATGRITSASTASITAGGMTNPMTTAGDLIYGGTSGTPTRLPIGTAGQVLKVNTAATGYEFGAASGTGDVTGPSSATSGRLAVFSGTSGKVIADSSTLTASANTLGTTASADILVAPAASYYAKISGNTVIEKSSADSFLSVQATSLSNSPTIGLFQRSSVDRDYGGYFLAEASTSDFCFVRRVNNVDYTFFRGKNTSGDVVLYSTTDSTSPTTGALIVSGGAGIAGRTSTGSLSISTTGTACDGLWSATATLDFGSIAAASQADLTLTVTGASVGDSVSLGLPAAPTSGIVFNAWVSDSDTVTVRATNITAAAIDPASATYRATVMSF